MSITVNISIIVLTCREQSPGGMRGARDAVTFLKRTAITVLEYSKLHNQKFEA